MILEYWNTIKAAVGTKRFAIDGFVGLTIWGLHWLGSKYFPVLQSIPNWSVAALVAVLLIMFWLVQYATELRLGMIPKVALSFEPRPPYVARLENSKIDGKIAPSLWFRVAVKNLQAAKIAKNVRVAIAKIEQKTPKGFEDTAFCNSQILSWSNRFEPERFAPDNVIAAEPRLVDVVSVDPVHNVVHVKWPLRGTWLDNEHIFDELGTYRLTVVATPEEGESASIRLLLHWNGGWDGTKMEVDPG